MKVLSILRHAKAERPEGYPNDFSRPLTTRGHKDGARMGAFLAGMEPAVDCILSSPAARAAQTAEHIAAELSYTKTVGWEAGIYLANADTLLELLRRAPEEAEHVVLIGHNPGLEELADGRREPRTGEGRRQGVGVRPEGARRRRADRRRAAAEYDPGLRRPGSAAPHEEEAVRRQT